MKSKGQKSIILILFVKKGIFFLSFATLFFVFGYHLLLIVRVIHYLDLIVKVIATG